MVETKGFWLQKQQEKGPSIPKHQELKEPNLFHTEYENYDQGTNYHSNEKELD
jgi:hypothetical protein